MSEHEPIAVFVKLGYWDSYRAAVVLTARIFRKVLYIFGFMGALWLFLLVLALVHPSPEKDWYQILQTSKQLSWVFGIPLIFVFVLPLLSAGKVIADERVKKGFSYTFSEAGIHVESSVAKTDMQWAAILQTLETRSAFLLFPNANMAHTLPKRCFATAADITSMRDLLRAHVAKAKLGKS
ncbi:MAG: hypothetical protein PVS2B2_10260 [Candidatus Acidiferrum sp.]